MNTILITGSTDGIGKLTAIQLAKENHTVYIHGRSQEKVASVIEAIKTTTNNQKIKGFVADFSDLNEVRAMANQIVETIPTLDVLINNAGIFKSSISKNKKGLDIRMVVNYLAPYVLTQAILSVIKASSAPRIINLSSAAQSPVSEAVLLGNEQVSDNASYAQSKLALTMWTMQLAKEEPDIIVIPVNPGSLLNTKMVSEAYGKHWSSAEKGMRILVDLALNKTHQTNSGKYFDNDRGEVKGEFAQAHADAYDTPKIKALLEITTSIT